MNSTSFHYMDTDDSDMPEMCKKQYKKLSEDFLMNTVSGFTILM